ncbi:hypothetical protein A2872_01830 [Candidatus Gottesmanbacteria bacterium RIFCSPHIGHO2_01_FULL_42_12]|uniref:Glutamyl-tRNA amidotransferase n=1 Tax=Candidatus Gottesmanbacteria bacterium RIFCSPHIGHO2_01_FULL_42_12 TaxID=1798377 RepID=A0A1F5Z5G1_9BACT|nr:MAG: hypothetical protein A2872_01830 [Candidatus Gottesmanbacteria bacterium RIFCSPHIGHO2_01_FULL_42_12]
MLLDQIQSDLNQALRDKDQLKVNCLRFLLGAAFNLQIEKGRDYVLVDDDLLLVINRQVKTHKESIEMFGKGGRQDLVDKESAELTILQSYLPKQMSEEEIKETVKEIKDQNPGADFGALMKLAMTQLKGKADGNIVSKYVRDNG